MLPSLLINFHQPSYGNCCFKSSSPKFLWILAWILWWCLFALGFSVLFSAIFYSYNWREKTLKPSWTLKSNNQGTNKRNKYRFSSGLFQPISASFKMLKCRYWYYVMWPASSYLLLESEQELDDSMHCKLSASSMSYQTDVSFPPVNTVMFSLSSPFLLAAGWFSCIINCRDIY